MGLFEKNSSQRRDTTAVPQQYHVSKDLSHNGITYSKIRRHCLIPFYKKSKDAHINASLLFEFSKHLLRAHDIVTSIDEHNLAGNGAGIVASQEERGIAHLALLDVAAQGRDLTHLFAERREA